ncbi:MAG TPA: hypothetical protein VD931_06905 [Baekduia sp.]|nr:hypothetical protein [Baekduia sp.]
MKRRLVLPLALLATLLAVPAAAPAATVGISDQQASTFTNPLYAPLKLKVARYIAPYDVMSDRNQLARWDAWYRAALASRQRILVAFEHSRLPGKEQRVPSTSEFKREMRAFRAAYRRVSDVTVWNEINRCQEGGRTEGQPRGLCKGSSGAKRLFGLYKVAKSVFKGKKIAAIDILDERNPGPAVKYIQAFKRVAGRRAPRYWGVHNYSDTNRFSTKRTAAILKAIGKGQKIWLTETGGIVKLGTSLPFSEERATKALGCMFSIAKKFKQIERLYIYQFNPGLAGASFDAGLIRGDGSTRPGYEVVRKRQARACRA